MNVKNNRRKKESREKIEKVFMTLLEKKEVREITVTELCEKTGLNRSTFYANYVDVFDLAREVKRGLENEFGQLFVNYNTAVDDYGALKMFKHVKENQLFYKTYFKLSSDGVELISIIDQDRASRIFDTKHMKYHIEFFRNGLNAIIKLWMDGGCKESPEEMVEILKQEYNGRSV